MFLMENILIIKGCSTLDFQPKAIISQIVFAQDDNSLYHAVHHDPSFKTFVSAIDTANLKDILSES